MPHLLTSQLLGRLKSVVDESVDVSLQSPPEVFEHG